MKKDKHRHFWVLRRAKGFPLEIFSTRDEAMNHWTQLYVRRKPEKITTEKGWV